MATTDPVGSDFVVVPQVTRCQGGADVFLTRIRKRVGSKDEPQSGVRAPVCMDPVPRRRRRAGRRYCSRPSRGATACSIHSSYSKESDS